MPKLLRAAFIASVALCLGTPAMGVDSTRSLLQLHHRAYGSEDGLPSSITAITQTADGYLWIGSASGLFRFDGQRFEPFAGKALLSSGISSLTPTESGDLWIGYATGGISRLHDGDITHFTADSGGPPGVNVDSIRVAPDGEELWAVVAGRQWRRLQGKWMQPLGNTQVWSMQLARDGVAWLKNGETLFYCRPHGAPCLPAAGYAGGVIGFTRDRDGRLWTSDTRAPGRLYRVPDIDGVPDTAIPAPDYQGALPPEIRGRFFLDRDYTVWNIHFANGLLRARPVLDSDPAPRQLDAFTARDGLTHDLAERIFEDREGSLWVSTKAGLDQFRPANVVLERAIATDVNAYAYWAARVGDALYLQASTGKDNSNPYAGNRGPLYRIDAKGTVTLLVDNAPGIDAVARTDDGAIWFSTMEGLRRLQGRKLLETDVPPGMQGDTTVFVAAQPGNGLMLSVYGDGVWEKRNGRWRQHPTMPAEAELRSSEYYGIGGDGAIWVAQANPFFLVRHHDGQLQRFKDAEVGIGRVLVFAASREVEYFGGARGIAQFDGQHFHSLNADRVPALTEVKGVAVVGDDVWVVCPPGILRFDRSAFEMAMRDPQAPAPAYELFDKTDGLPAGFDLPPQSAFENAVQPLPDGRILFLTGAGVVWIDPHHLFRNPVPPTVTIASLTANGQAHESPRALQLPAGSGNVEIHYAALSFVEPSRVRFQYQLEHVDNDWVDPGMRREAFYTQLAPGTYRFRVKAANEAGVWNVEGATLDFSIAPTFLQSIWFKLIAAAAVLVLLFAAYVARLRWETARLGRQFEIRNAERERIARELHDTLLQGVQGLVLRVHAITATLPAAEPARGALEQTLDRADLVLQEGRDRVRGLRLPDATGDLPQLVTEAAAMQITDEQPHFTLTVEGSKHALLSAAQEEILRIAEEAIGNAVRHAHARRIEVVITYARSSLQVLIRDDGIGMNADAVAARQRAGHFGLTGMQERAARIGASLAIGNGGSSGVEVLLCVPARKAYFNGRSWRIGTLGQWWKRRV